MVPQRIYLDLDRTLFDTKKFMDDLYDACEELFGVSGQTLRDETPDFYKEVNGLPLYDFFIHIATHGITYEVAERKLRTKLRGRSYLYGDVGALLQTVDNAAITTRILSFGAERYQKFKASMAPELGHLPIDVVLHKDQYLVQQPALPSLLVDDKPTAQLPNWCTLLLLDRSAREGSMQEAPLRWRINSLKKVDNFLK